MTDPGELLARSRAQGGLLVRRRRWLRSSAAALALVVIAGGVLVRRDSDRPTSVRTVDHGPTSMTAPSDSVRWTFDQLSFTAPVAWKPQKYDVVATMFTVVAYLSTTTLHEPCSHPDAETTTCGYPVDHLGPDDVLVTWTTSGEQRAAPSGVTVDRPGSCGALGAAETVTDFMPADGVGMTACIPDDRAIEAAMRAMVTSASIAAGGGAQGHFVASGRVSFPVFGTVEAHLRDRAGPLVASTVSDAEGRFSMALPAGTYVLVGSSPRINGAAQACVSRELLTVGATWVDADVVCDIF